MLAGELRLHGVRTVVLEKDAEPTRSSARSACTCAASRSWTSAGCWTGSWPRHQSRSAASPASTKPAPPDLDTSHPYILGIPQPVTDRLLDERAAELGAEIRRGCESWA